MPLEEHLRRLVKGLNGDKVVIIQEKETPDTTFMPRLIQDPIQRSFPEFQPKRKSKTIQRIRNIFSKRD